MGKDLVVRATRSSFDPEDMAGVSAPLGFWDPAGFAKDEESVLQYRRAEIKHGRVCMSSSLGMLVADKFHPIFDNWNEGEFVYGFDPLNLRPEDPEKQKEYKTMELNHGRWAMFCAAGIIAQELVTGKSVI